jgi:F-type H+-transporting ATPase subunit gamma
MVSTLMAATAGKVESPLMVPHEGRGKVIVVAMASDMSLCGAFNHNAVRLLETTVAGLLGKDEEYDSLSHFGSVEIIPVGNKMAVAAAKLGYQVKNDVSSDDLGGYLIDEYLSGRADKVLLLYHHFLSVGSQKPVCEQLLPFAFQDSTGSSSADVKTSDTFVENSDYIFEPSAEVLLQQVVPYCVKTKVRAAILDNTLSEHAARMVAMQTATDNAKELLDELRLNYNKQRQQAITAELADIASSTLQ